MDDEYFDYDSEWDAKWYPKVRRLQDELHEAGMPFYWATNFVRRRDETVGVSAQGRAAPSGFYPELFKLFSALTEYPRMGMVMMSNWKEIWERAEEAGHDPGYSGPPDGQNYFRRTFGMDIDDDIAEALRGIVRRLESELGIADNEVPDIDDDSEIEEITDAIDDWLDSL